MSHLWKITIFGRWFAFLVICGIWSNKIVSLCGFLTSNLKNVKSRISFPLYDTKPIRTLLIDNYDSYTYNLWQLLAQVNGVEPVVLLNNRYEEWEKIKGNSADIRELYDNIVISPGPGNPSNIDDFGVSLDALKTCDIPILGVCLGHQGIAYAFGGEIIRSPEPMHGRISKIQHSNTGIFSGIPQDFEVVRYHSLIAQQPLPNILRKTAWTSDIGICMGLEHMTKPIYGVQFHPESISTSYGKKIMENFRDISKESNKLIIKQKNSSLFSSKIIRSKSYENKKSEESLKKTTWKRHIHILQTSVLEESNIPIEKILPRLFGNSSSVFLLDSVTKGHDKLSGNFSFFGALETSECEAIEYQGNNNLYIRRGWSPEDNLGKTSHQIMNIFEYLDKEIRNEIDITTEISMDGIPNGLDLPFKPTEALFGYIGYEAKNTATHILSASRINSQLHDFASTRDDSFKENHWTKQLEHPMAMFMKPSRFIVQDKVRNCSYIVALSRERYDILEGLPDEYLSDISKRQVRELLIRLQHETSIAVAPNSLQSDDRIITLTGDASKQQYQDRINKTLEYIRQGETYEVCLTTQYHGKLNEDNSEAYSPLISALQRYSNLRQGNPAPYSSFLYYNPLLRSNHKNVTDIGLEWSSATGFAILCSSPERFLKVDENRIIETKPIKGTSRRDLLDSQNDLIIAKNLLEDEKSRSENLMIVDLVRNDLGRVCEIGSVHVPKLMQVETYASVHQLVSTICGKLDTRYNVADVLVATFPGGSMTGAPKIRTMDIIDELENRPRGIYSGTIGYIGMNGIADLNIVIRTALMLGDQNYSIVNELKEKRQWERITIAAGGAIIILSDVCDEVDEVILKASAVSKALNVNIQFAT